MFSLKQAFKQKDFRLAVNLFCLVFALHFSTFTFIQNDPQANFILIIVLFLCFAIGIKTLLKTSKFAGFFMALASVFFIALKLISA